MRIKEEILELLGEVDRLEKLTASKYSEAMRIVDGYRAFKDLILEIIEYSKTDTTKRFDWDFWIRRAEKNLNKYEEK